MGYLNCNLRSLLIGPSSHILETILEIEPVEDGIFPQTTLGSEAYCEDDVQSSFP